jgi:hypothetical protein
MWKIVRTSLTKRGICILELPENILIRRDPLLSSDRETDNETTSAARQQILSKQIYAAVTE